MGGGGMGRWSSPPPPMCTYDCNITSIILQFGKTLTFMFCKPSADAGINRFDRTTETTTTAHIFTILFRLQLQTTVLIPCSVCWKSFSINFQCWLLFLGFIAVSKVGGDFAYCVPPTFKVTGDRYTMSPPQRRPWYESRVVFYFVTRIRTGCICW